MAILDVDDLSFKNSLSLKNIKGTVTQLLNESDLKKSLCY